MLLVNTKWALFTAHLIDNRKFIDSITFCVICCCCCCTCITCLILPIRKLQQFPLKLIRNWWGGGSKETNWLFKLFNRFKVPSHQLKQELSSCLSCCPPRLIPRCLLSAVVQLIKRFCLLLCIFFAISLSLSLPTFPFFYFLRRCRLHSFCLSHWKLISLPVCSSFLSLSLPRFFFLFLVAQLTQINTLSSGLPAALRESLMQQSNTV